MDVSVNVQIQVGVMPDQSGSHDTSLHRIVNASTKPR